MFFYKTVKSKNGGGEVQHASPALLTSQGDPGHQQVNRIHSSCHKINKS